MKVVARHRGALIAIETYGKARDLRRGNVIEIPAGHRVVPVHCNIGGLVTPAEKPASRQPRVIA
jgi:hypothetical protein